MTYTRIRMPNAVTTSSDRIASTVTLQFARNNTTTTGVNHFGDSEVGQADADSTHAKPEQTDLCGGWLLVRMMASDNST